MQKPERDEGCRTKRIPEGEASISVSGCHQPQPAARGKCSGKCVWAPHSPVMQLACSATMGHQLSNCTEMTGKLSEFHYWCILIKDFQTWQELNKALKKKSFKNTDSCQILLYKAHSAIELKGSMQETKQYLSSTFFFFLKRILNILMIQQTNKQKRQKKFLSNVQDFTPF